MGSVTAPTVVLLSLLPIFYLSIFAHELGHAVIGHAVGLTVSSFGIGLGRPWLVVSRGRTRIFFCRTHPFQGITFCLFPHMFPLRRMMVPFLAGGIIANSLLAVGALALSLWFPWGRSAWITIMAVNALLAITCVLPYQVKVGKVVLRTDGRLILEVIRDRVIRTPSAAVIQTLDALRGLWKSIGDRNSLQAHLLASAIAHVGLEDLERADLLLTEAHSLGKSNEPVLQVLGLLVRSAIDAEAGKFEQAAQALDDAERILASLADQGGLLVVSIQRAVMRVQQSDAAGAADELKSLVVHPLARQNPLIFGSLLAARLEAHVALSDTLGADQILAEYEKSRRRHTSLATDLAVYKAMASLHSRQEDWLQAEPAYRKAIAAITAVMNAWPHAADRNRFLERQSAFLAEAGHCFQVLDKFAEFDRIVPRASSAEEIQQGAAAAHRLRDRRLLRAGLWLFLINIICIACEIAVVWSVRAGTMPFISRELDFILIVVPIYFVVSSLLAVLCLAFYAVFGRFIPSSRHNRGALVLVLACLPWLSLLVIPLALLFDSRR